MNENLQPLVSIVVLNFNAKDFLIKCIDSIFQSQYKDFEVILVDNASEDDTYKICKENHPEINLIINQENLGYCGGNNVGIKNATGEFIIILNPDTLVDPNWINEFLLQEFSIKVPILYGGSVTASNCGSMIDLENISGFLIGTSSLDVNEFSSICSIVNER